MLFDRRNRYDILHRGKRVWPVTFNDDDTGPETYGEIDNSARFPEWQCEIADMKGDGFWDRPAFCQQEMLQRLSDVEFRGLMGWNSFADPENINNDNPQMPPHEGDPGGLAQAHGDPVSSAILADALTSSSKPSGPSDGEDCTDSDTVICTRVPRANDPLANIDASVGSDAANQLNNRFPVSLVRPVRMATEMLKFGPCSQLFGSNAADILNDIFVHGKIDIVDKIPDRRGPDGRIHRGHAFSAKELAITNTLASFSTNRPFAGTKMIYFNAKNFDPGDVAGNAFNLLHELLHYLGENPGNISHRDKRYQDKHQTPFANAISSRCIYLNPEYNDLDYRPPDPVNGG